MEQVTIPKIGKHIFLFQKAIKEQKEGMIWCGQLESESPPLGVWSGEFSASPQFLYFKMLDSMKKGLPLASAKTKHISGSSLIHLDTLGSCQRVFHTPQKGGRKINSYFML